MLDREGDAAHHGAGRSVASPAIGPWGHAPSFSEEKEAKRLLILWRRGLTARLTGQIEKVFWFFFPKKNKDASQQ
ncbi:hypothetical protein [Acidomonas methanolica]|uniref:hypothetical protein n=1 Tax=Acidomonas methanolica TaxID=437 RepID=UPI00211A337F|nr:hypothetical protein [Acidomonas methanolica]MCQ9156606.1 hypothetical protein [Acidomonas methanolica]